MVTPISAAKLHINPLIMNIVMYCTHAFASTHDYCMKFVGVGPIAVTIIGLGNDM